MCCRLTNSYHCLTLLTILGALQVLASVPIVVLSFLVFFLSQLGILLSPFWCGFWLMITGLTAILIRPTRLALIICLHVVLNSVAIMGCIIAGGLAGLYGTSVHLPTFADLITPGQNGSNTSTVQCIFSDGSQLYSNDFRMVFAVIDDQVTNCSDLNTYWSYLIALMSLCFVGMVISIIAIFTNCITPCVEDRYANTWEPKSSES